MIVEERFSQINRLSMFLRANHQFHCQDVNSLRVQVIGCGKDLKGLATRSIIDGLWRFGKLLDFVGGMRMQLCAKRPRKPIVDIILFQSSKDFIHLMWFTSSFGCVLQILNSKDRFLTLYLDRIIVSCKVPRNVNGYT